jgi:hypothetical protein
MLELKADLKRRITTSEPTGFQDRVRSTRCDRKSLGRGRAMVLGSSHEPDDEGVRLRELGTQVEFRAEPRIHRWLME